MTKLVFAILITCVLLKMEIKSQANFSISIVPSGSTTICGTGTVGLIANPTGNHWTQISNFLGGYRLNAVGFGIGNKGYVGTGWETYYSKDFWEYDPATNTWTQKADFAGGIRTGAVAFSIGTKGYIGLGNNNNSGTLNGDIYNDFWEYDPVTNAWVRKADFAGSPRFQATGFNIGNKGYIGTGLYLGAYLDDFWEYDPIIDVWVRKANIGSGGRCSSVGFGIGSKGYIGTGLLGSTFGGVTDDFWEYDPLIDVWTQKTNFAGGVRQRAVGFNIGCKGYIGTGDFFNTYNDFWEYDPTTDSWIIKANFGGTARYSAVGFNIGGKGYIGLGNIYSTDFWEYDPTVTYSWSNGATTQSITATVTGVYSVTIASVACFTATTSQSVSISPIPIVSVNSSTLCSGTSVVLTASVVPSAGTVYSWSSGSSSNASVTLSPTSSNNYTVTATNAGCSSSAVSSLTVFPSTTAVTDFTYSSPVCMNSSNPLPNVTVGFSPNGFFSSASGLSLDTSTGLIDLNSSTAGSYAVTYSVATSNCMFGNMTTAPIVINAPTQAITDFSYSAPICLLAEDPLPILDLNFTGDGNYASSNGLSIDAVTGLIDLSNSVPGNYTVTYSVNTSSVSCVLAGTNSVSVVIQQNPVITVNPVSIINFGDNVNLVALSSAGTYTWYPTTNLSCTFCADPFASPNETTNYCVKTTDGSCTNSVCITVKVKMPCSDIAEMALPNAFSPNGDGSNDQFCIQGENACIKNFAMMIYDRWGEKVFETSNPDFCWDGTYNGKILDPNVFVYYIKGLYNNDKDFLKKGNITLIK